MENIILTTPVALNQFLSFVSIKIAYCIITFNPRAIIKSADKIFIDLLSNTFLFILTQQGDAFSSPSLMRWVPRYVMKKISIKSLYIVKAGKNNYSDNNYKQHYNPSLYDDALKKGQAASIGSLIGMIIYGPVGAFIGAVQGFYMASLSSMNNTTQRSIQYYQSMLIHEE